MSKQKVLHLSPGRIILLSFAAIIGLGTFLLWLPAARTTEIALFDLFFTSASTTCVTGLTVIPVSSFTFFGKCVLLALIQVGGLGLITLSYFIVSFFLQFGIASRLLAGHIFEFELWGKLRQFLMLIVGMTFACEAIGTAILYAQFAAIPCPDGRFFTALFHAVSAFCSAGITTFDNNLIGIGHHPGMLLTLSILMFLGSIGFVVWYDFARFFRTRHFKASLHTKITLTSSLLFVLVGGFIIWVVEQDYLLAPFSEVGRIANAFFYAISMRGPGFYTMPVANASQPTLLTSLVFMFVGASPGSMGSGIKTTAFVIFVATVFSIMRGRSSVELAGRRIPTDQVYKVMALVSLGLFWIFISTFVMLLFERNMKFVEVLFEAVSAFGTCGLSTGITPMLSSASKITLIVTMLVGRVGALTLALALRRKESKHVYEYPEERIMIG